MTDNKGFYTTNNMGDPTGRFYISKDVPNKRSFEDDKLPGSMRETFEMVNAGMFSQESQMEKIHCDVNSMIIDEIWAMPTALNLIGKSIQEKVNNSIIEYYKAGGNLDGKHIEFSTDWDEYKAGDELVTGTVKLEVKKNER